MALLESTLRNLRDGAEFLFREVEKAEPEEKLKRLLNDDYHEAMEESQEDLMLKAFTQIGTMEERHRILPTVGFLVEVYKIILDSLR